MEVKVATLALDALADAARRHETMPVGLLLEFPYDSA
jgi:hypothetical protein